MQIVSEGENDHGLCRVVSFYWLGNKWGEYSILGKKQGFPGIRPSPTFWPFKVGLGPAMAPVGTSLRCYFTTMSRYNEAQGPLESFAILDQIRSNQFLSCPPPPCHFFHTLCPAPFPFVSEPLWRALSLPRETKELTDYPQQNRAHKEVDRICRVWSQQEFEKEFLSTEKFPWEGQDQIKKMKQRHL